MSGFYDTGIKYIVHCSGEEEIISALNTLHEMGYTWSSGIKLIAFKPDHDEIFLFVQDFVTFSSAIGFANKRYDPYRFLVVEATEFCDQHSARIILDADVELLYE